MADSPVLYELSGRVGILTLNRPDARNAINPEMACALVESIEHFKADPNASVLVVTGKGNTFCSGGDLSTSLPLLSGAKTAENVFEERVVADRLLLARAVFRDLSLDKPVIAAVNGACLAGGTEMLLNVDIRLAVPEATFGLPEVKLALTPFAGALARLSRDVGYCRAMDLLLTGDTITARKALDVGLINEIVEGDVLIERAMNVAERIARNGAVAVRAVKRAVLQSVGVPLEQGYAIEDATRELVMATSDSREGPLAFMQKRSPQFRGR